MPITGVEVMAITGYLVTVCHALSKRFRNIRNVGSTIAVFAKEITEFSAVLKNVQNTVTQFGVSGFIERCGAEHWTAIAKSLYDVKESLQNLELLLLESESDSGGVPTFFRQAMQKLRLDWNALDIDLRRKEIALCRQVLMMSLNMVQVTALARQERQLAEMRSMIEDLHRSQQLLARTPTMETLRGLQTRMLPVDGMSTVQPGTSPPGSNGTREVVFPEEDLESYYVGQLEFRIIQNQRREAAQKLDSKEYSAAEVLLIHVIEKSKKWYGSLYYWREMARTMLVRAYMEQHKGDEAERELLQSAAEQEQDKREREAAEIKHNLALIAFTKGDYSKAESYCQQALFLKKQVVVNPWDHSVYASMQLLVQILEANKDGIKASTYKSTLQNEMWMSERNAIARLSAMTPYRASVEIGLNYLVDLLPADDDNEERWKQIRKNIRNRMLGLCGSGYGYTLLHAVVEFGQDDTIRYLVSIEQNARLVHLDCFVDVRDKDDNSPLHFAARGRLEIVRLLLEHGADVNIKSKNLQTPLMVATKAGRVDIVQLLLEYSSDLTVKDEYRWTALHYAIFESQGEIIELLLDRGVDVDILGASGRTPLHCASLREREDIVRLLLERGADSRAKDADDRTPLKLAEKHPRKETNVRILNSLNARGQ